MFCFVFIHCLVFMCHFEWCCISSGNPFPYFFPQLRGSHRLSPLELAARTENLVAPPVRHCIPFFRWPSQIVWFIFRFLQWISNTAVQEHGTQIKPRNNGPRFAGPSSRLYLYPSALEKWGGAFARLRIFSIFTKMFLFSIFFCLAFFWMCYGTNGQIKPETIPNCPTD